MGGRGMVIVSGRSTLALMTKWLSLGAAGVVFLIAGAFLITSGISVTSGQILGVVGVVLILISVVVFPFAVRWALFRTKGRAVLFGVGIVGRIIIGAVLLLAAIGSVLYMTT
jgi:hypothetical protein